MRSSTTSVRRNWKALPGGVLFGVATVSYYVLRRQHPLEDPSHAGYATVFILRCAAVVLIAIGLAAVLLDTTRRRRSVARIVATLDEAPPVGGLDSALARALGDTSLRICYWLPAAGRYVDADGREVPDPSTDTSVTATPLVRNGQTVAVVSHHSDPVELEQRLGSAIRLALDNERLQADMYVRMQTSPNRGRGSSRLATCGAAVSSATSTTAPSRACSASRSTSASPARQRRRAGMLGSPPCSTRRSAKSPKHSANFVISPTGSSRPRSLPPGSVPPSPRSPDRAPCASTSTACSAND